MSNIIVKILILTIFSQILCKEYWQCDAAGKYTCSNSQTCCRSSVSGTGWACFPAIKGVCCSDGISCCPFANVCNLREKRCDPLPKTFLSELSYYEDSEVDQNFLEANMTAVSDSSLDFAKAFLEGFTFFNNLPHQAECQIEDPQIGQDFVDIANLIKGITIKSDFKQIVNDIMTKSRDILLRIKQLSGSCKPYGEELTKVLDALVSHVSSATYYPKLAFHTVSNIGEISEKVKKATSSFSQDQFKEAGFAFGDLTKYVVFWDFKVPEIKAFLQQIDTIKDTKSDLEDFLRGLNDGFGFFKGLPHADECNPDDPQLIQDVLDIVELLKNVTPKSDFSEIIQKLLAKAQDIYSRLGQISTGCTAYANEVKKVIDALSAYVRKDGYTNSLFMHTLGNMGTITEKFNKGVDSGKNKQFHESGNTFGELFRFVLFWDYK